MKKQRKKLSTDSIKGRLRGGIWHGYMSIALISQLWEEGKLVANPQYQRQEVQKLAWKQRLIASMLRNDKSSCLYLRECENGTYEILDGQQRLTTIRDFVNNVFPTASNADEGFNVKCEDGEVSFVPPKQYFSDLQKHDDWYDEENEDIGSLQEMWNEATFTTQLYVGLTDDDASEVFCALNDSVKLNDQEQRNGISGSVSDIVRRKARDESKEQLPALSRWKMTSHRMNKDEVYAKSMLYERYHQKIEGGIYCKTMNKSYLEDFYKNKVYRKGGKALKDIVKGVDKRWALVDDICRGAAARNWTGESSKLLTLFQITYWLEEWFGVDFEMDEHVFGSKLMIALNELCSKNSKKYGTYNRKTRFGELLSLYTPSELQEKRDLLYNELNSFEGDLGIHARDNVRFFPEEMRYRKLVEQGMKCALTGVPLTLENSEGDHILAHHLGGKTDYDNLQVLAKDVNARKGTMSNDEYINKYMN